MTTVGVILSTFKSKIELNVKSRKTPKVDGREVLAIEQRGLIKF